MGQILGGFLIVYLVGKLIQKLLTKFTGFTPTKALAVSILISVALCSLAAYFTMGAVSFIIYPLGGIGAWFYCNKRISQSAKSGSSPTTTPKNTFIPEENSNIAVCNFCGTKNEKHLELCTDCDKPL